MQIISLRKKIAKNSIILLILLSALGLCLYYKSDRESTLIVEIDKIRTDINNANKEISRINNSVNESQKYLDLWKSLPAAYRATKNIRPEEIYNKAETLGKKYYVSSLDVKTSSPETIDSGIFQRNTIDTFYMKINMSFNAISDIYAISYIADFMSAIPGRIVLSQLNISNSKRYIDRKSVV